MKTIGTKAAHNRPVERWFENCRKWNYNLQHPTVSLVLHFVHALFTQGLGHGAINSHCGVSSSELQVPGVERTGEHILVSRFI